MERQNKKSELGRRISSWLSTLVLVVAIILCLQVVTQVSTNGYVEFGGISFFRVVTGSMEPTLPVGTLLICQRAEMQDIREGDIVCFRSRNPEVRNKIVTHRVVNITFSGEGELLLETKGDANLSADGEFVTAQNLVGRVNHYTKDGNFMASLVNLLTNQMGFMLLILFPTLLIAGFILRSCMLSMRRDIDETLAQEKEKQQDITELYTEEEHAAMLERIKKELLEELRLEAEADEETTDPPEKTE